MHAENGNQEQLMTEHVIPACGSTPTENDVPILFEIRHALARLIDEGQETMIDLRGMPMSSGEEKRIEAFLGVGEVRAMIDTLGPSEVCETAIPGVWFVRHRNTEQELIGTFIEITYVPSILKSQIEDIQDGLTRLDERLSGL